MNRRKQPDGATASIRLQLVTEMRQQYLGVLAVLRRGLFAGCYDQHYLQARANALNLQRLRSQDAIVLCNASGRPVIEGFAQQVEHEHNAVARQERNLLPPTRLANMIQAFKTIFSDPNLPADDTVRTHLANLLERHTYTFQQQFAADDLRSRMKHDLLHDLLDDMYRSLDAVYQDVQSQRKALDHHVP